MRLAVFDTNVIISAAISRSGIPAQLVFDWVLEGRVRLAVSAFVIREYREVVRRPKFLRYSFPPEWLGLLVEESLYLDDPGPWPVAMSDPEDSRFLALAHAAGAWLVTGNLRHFPPSTRRGVTVLSPGDYLAHLNNG